MVVGMLLIGAAVAAPSLTVKTEFGEVENPRIRTQKSIHVLMKPTGARNAKNGKQRERSKLVGRAVWGCPSRKLALEAGKQCNIHIYYNNL